MTDGPRLGRDDGDFVRAACSESRPHDAHFYQSFIVGGAPGPVPSLTCLCAGVTDG